jgi:hypothetical protein
MTAGVPNQLRQCTASIMSGSWGIKPGAGAGSDDTESTSHLE